MASYDPNVDYSDLIAQEAAKGVNANRQLLAQYEAQRNAKIAAEHLPYRQTAVYTSELGRPLGYYASDVAAHEPVRPKDGLLHCPNVLLTPHVAWATEEALARLSAEVCANLQAFLRGERRNLV